jgi:hypothetical protein
MNATMMLVLLAGSLTVSQNDGTVFRASKVQVKLQIERVNDKDFPFHMLLYNRINIGRNFRKPRNPQDFGNPELDWSRLATTYFHREGPLGVVMEQYNWFPGKWNTYQADARLPASMIGVFGVDPCGQLGQLVSLWSEPPIAVVELDIGTMASYARPAQTLHFFNPTPSISRLSFPEKDGQPLFHYVPDALVRGANISIFEGEPRASIEKNGGAGFYQVIVVNTYKLPVVTVHKDLMTKEGMQMLMSKTRDEGILCYHTSSRYYDLQKIIASVAAELKYDCQIGRDLLDDYEKGHFTSDWVMVARDKKYLAHLKSPPGYDQALGDKRRLAVRFWSPPQHTNKKFAWTDKGENSFRGIYRSDPSIGEFGMWLNEAERFVFDNVGFLRGLNRHMQPVHNALQKWSVSNAAFLNREPRETPKKSEKQKEEKKIDKEDEPTK